MKGPERCLEEPDFLIYRDRRGRWSKLWKGYVRTGKAGYVLTEPR